MEYFFSYHNKKTNLRLFFDARNIDSISLVEISTYTGLKEVDDKDDNENDNISDNTIKRVRYRYKHREEVYVTQLLLKIHFKNSNYYEKFIFAQDDEEAHIIYNLLTEFINKNPQSCH